MLSAIFTLIQDRGTRVETRLPRVRAVRSAQCLPEQAAMLAIIISACLINDPSVCKDYKVPLLADVSQNLCMLHAPPHFAKWAEDHPGWQIKSWRCGAASDQDI